MAVRRKRKITTGQERASKERSTRASQEDSKIKITTIRNVHELPADGDMDELVAYRGWVWRFSFTVEADGTPGVGWVRENKLGWGT